MAVDAGDHGVKTPTEILAIRLEHAQQAEQWAATHRDTANWPRALGNWTSAAGGYVFRGLVGWRTGLIDPIPEFRAALAVAETAVGALEASDVGPLRPLYDPVAGAYAALLLDRPTSPAVAETQRLAVRPAPRGLTVDRALEGWLIGVFVGRDPGDGPAMAAEMGAKKRTSLVGATYGTYFALATLNQNELATATDLTREAVALFARRRDDPYYTDGVDYEGGDVYNDLVVDMHLAAIWQLRGWDPSALTPDERLHVRLPSSDPAATR